MLIWQNTEMSTVQVQYDLMLKQYQSDRKSLLDLKETFLEIKTRQMNLIKMKEHHVSDEDLIQYMETIY